MAWNDVVVILSISVTREAEAASVAFRGFDEAEILMNEREWKSLHSAVCAVRLGDVDACVRNAARNSAKELLLYASAATDSSWDVAVAVTRTPEAFVRASVEVCTNPPNVTFARGLWLVDILV